MSEGKFEQLKGNVQESVGNAIGDEKLEAEGKENKATGKVKETVENVSDSIKGAIDDLKK
ncbi:CsbD family protein [Macrococcus capreoli]|uniref:CsbD family protein n=1 Tax=Macrococcus capreoli TaxID=2982690 RepID=UPI0021D5DA99|nr:CsbD family protein [Macrococcus sp. TMW 2.2395]MCU7557612.1 CsbD family protein [Macrococcus sp. TMW 2.2395]